MLRLKTLHPQRQAVDACCGKACKTLALEGARIGFHGDFGIGQQAHARPYACEQFVYGCGLKQAGRAATYEDGFHAAAPDVRQLVFQIL